jgi:DNA polymerase-3 subunit beta
LENDDFPNIPFVTTEQGNFLPIAELINTPIGSLASIDETKQVLKGINFSFAEEGDRKTIRGMATDGHRLARHRISSICEAFTACTIPSKTITTVQYIANSLGHSRDIDVLLGATDVTFRIGGDAQLYSRILDGAYPNCEALIPKQFTNEVKINRGQVVTAVGILSNFSPNVSIKYRSGESTFLLSAQSDIGSGEQEISIEYNGIGDDEATLWFNSKYLLDALNLFDDEEISIYWNLPNTPVILQPESSDVLALVMPVQMPGR